jgi:Protein of unknown function (DUF4231)
MAEELKIPVSIATHPAWMRLESQMNWMSGKAARFQDRYRHIKLGLIGISASIPLIAMLRWEHAPIVVALCGVAIALLEGILLLGQYSTLWVSYRATAEQLKRERWLLLSRAGEYRGMSDDEALRLLAEHVEEILAKQNGSWSEQMSQMFNKLANTSNWVAEQRGNAPGGGGAQ